MSKQLLDLQNSFYQVRILGTDIFKMNLNYLLNLTVALKKA
jgi:hypothetical protein